MADPYAPFGYRPPTLGPQQQPMLPFPIPPMPEPSMAPGGAMPSPQEAQSLAMEPNLYRMLIEASGMGPAGRSRQAFSEGRPWEGIGHAAIGAIPYRPAFGFAGLGGAYGGAMAETMMPGTSQAQAQQPAANDQTVLQSLLDRQGVLQNEANQARDRREIERKSGEGNRFKAADQEYQRAQSRLDAINKQVETLTNRMSPEAMQQRREYSGAVDVAERGLAEARSRRVRPFSETPVGRLYEATGGVTPAAFGFGTAALARAIGRPRLEAALEGTAAGAATPNAPFVWDMLAQPAANPEREMYSAYARDLPPTHPRRQEWTDYAQGLPEQNPARRLAAEEFYNWGKLGERTLLGTLEGAVGGMAGANAAEGARMIGSSVGSGLGAMFGRRSGTPPPGPAAPTAMPPGPGLTSLETAQRSNPPPLTPEAPPPVPAQVNAPPRPMPAGAFQARNGRWMVMTPNGPRFIPNPE